MLIRYFHQRSFKNQNNLHYHWFARICPPCTFIDFPENFHPARLFRPARLMFSKNFPTCEFILSYTSIRYTRVLWPLATWAQNWIADWSTILLTILQYYERQTKLEMVCIFFMLKYYKITVWIVTLLLMSDHCHIVWD